jgi:hypothetical protein
MSPFHALALSLLCAAPDGGVVAPPLAVHTRALPDKAQLGEPFEYEIVITHEKGQLYELRSPGELPDFELIDQTRSRQDGNQSATTTFKLKISGFTLGKKELPRLTFDIDEPDRRGSVQVEGPEVEILGTLPPDAEQKGAQLYGLKPLEEVPVRSWRLLYALAGLCAAGALAYGLYRLWKRPRAPEAALVAPPKALHERAMEALEALRAEDLPGKGRVREYYFRLSEILRGYLGELYHFEALESTSSELIEALGHLTAPGLPLKDFISFIHESDLAKFARAPLGPEDCRRALELGYRLVNDTTNASPARVS